MNVAIVPARSGSKRLPNKNIKLLNGLPLVCWTINAFLRSDCFDRVIFSSDSNHYFDVVSDNISDPRLSFHSRTNVEAGDKVKIFDYLRESYTSFCSKDDCLAMGLPTAPLRTSDQIREAFQLSIKSGRSVFSASEYDFSVPFAFTLQAGANEENQTWTPLFGNESPMITGNTRSQDQLKYLHPNGAIYVIQRAAMLNSINTFYHGSIPYVMDALSSIDVDTLTDFSIAEAVCADQYGKYKSNS